MRRRHRLYLATITASVLLLPGGSLYGQSPLPHDTLRVEVGSRLVAGAAALTRSVDVLDRAAIEALPVRSVADVIARALGVDLQARSAAQADLSIRGSGFEQVLVLVDGVPVNDDQTGHFHLDHAVPLDAVERVEVLRGPASALYGSAAVGGVVNLVTRRGRSELVARTQVGSFGAAAVGGEAALAGRRIAARVSADHDRSDGHRPGTDHRITQARLAVDAPLADGTMRGDVAYAGRDFGAEGFYAPFDSYEETRTLTAALSWRPAPRTWTLQPRVSFRRHDDDFVLRRDDPSFYRNQHTNRQLSAELVARWLPAERLRVAVGGEALRSELQSGTLGDRREDRGAAFIEVAAGTSYAMMVTGGVRVDHHSVFGTFASPSLSAGWRAADALRLRASAGLGFRAPTWTERYYRDPANIGTEDLGGESFRTAELGIEVHGGRTSLDVAGFVRRATDLIDWARARDATDDEPWRTLNVARATFAGLETTVRAGIAGLDLTARATALEFGADAAAGMESKYALRPLTRTASLAAAGRLPAGVTGTVRGSHQRRAGGGAWQLVDARVARSFGDVDLFADATNLLDERYADIVGRPAPGRAFSVGARVRR
jgi:vitamin B12 transporter